MLQETREVESPTFIGTMTFLYLINSKFFGKMTIDINQSVAGSQDKDKTFKIFFKDENILYLLY